jgi:hypothetical protein
MTPLKIMVASILLVASLLVFNGLNANSAHEFAGQIFRGDGEVEHHEREHGTPGAPTGGEVTGSVFAEVPGLGSNGSIGEILLPDITVFLRKPSSSAMSHPVTTDLNGRFALPAHPRGVYQLCLKADGYVAGCRPDPVVVEGTTVYLSPIAIQPLPRVIAGRVTRRDQSPCRFKDAFFDVDVHTSVELVDRGKHPKADGVIRRARANNLGEYLLAEVPPGSFAVRATCAEGKVEQRVTTSHLAIVDLILSNANPAVKLVVATVKGKGVRRVAPGTAVEVTVQAEDADGDTLHYRWSPAYPVDGFHSHDSPTIRWTVPRSKALHTIYVLVHDKRGGFALGKVNLSTEDEGALFSGRVSGPGASGPSPLSAASVSINGVVTQTNREGYFLVRIPREGPRYVLNITKDGYQPLSKVFEEETLGGRYHLAVTQSLEIDPNVDTDVAEFSEDREGARVVIPAGALVDQHGNPPTGLLKLFLSVIDQRDPEGRLPGDYGAVAASGREVTLTGFGAVHIEIKDGAGNSYNLMSGKTAFVRIPAEGTAAPPSSALWRYDTDTGRWREDAPANLVGDHYEGAVTRLGVLNAAAATPEADLMRLLVNSMKVKLPLDVRITVPAVSGFTRVFTKRITDPISIISHLPPLTRVTLEILDSARNPIPGSAQLAESGPPLPPATPSAPTYPYGSAVGVAIVASYLPPVPATGFLNYMENDEALAKAYYKAIDPKNQKTDFQLWRWRNAIELPENAKPAQRQISAAYQNAGDLGFGRVMRSDVTRPCPPGVGASEPLVCGRPGRADGVAYYVSNHPTVEDATTGRNGFAIVAMEYSPQPKSTGPSFTKFFVFGPGGSRVLSADLDGRGQKFVPGLCMVCHGGASSTLTPQTLGTGNVGARFLPFDLESFEYSGRVGSRQVDQEEQFKALNLRLRQTNISQATNTLLLGWYGGVELQSPTFIPTFVPALWAGNERLYSSVVKPACRTCHVTRDAGLDWATLDSFNARSGRIQSLVCGDRSMPQAKVTWERFWASTNPHQPDVLAAAGLTKWNPSIPCPQP